MANIKHTKNELKAQREALKRFQRYLPTLQLKKQQLQLEVRQLESQLEAERNAEVHEQAELAKWVRLFAEPVEWRNWLSVRKIRLGQGNIAGVAIPLLEGSILSARFPICWPRQRGWTTASTCWSGEYAGAWSCRCSKSRCASSPLSCVPPTSA
jgi:hypothetical protein